MDSGAGGSADGSLEKMYIKFKPQWTGEYSTIMATYDEMNYQITDYPGTQVGWKEIKL